MPRVLVTNDDGIDAPGLRAAVVALVDHGYDPYVIAPNRDYSGAGGSLLSVTATATTDGAPELRYDERVLEEAPDVEAYALHGPPALCAMVACRGAFGPVPDLVVSGINYGVNTGPAVFHSGTVNAATTSARAGVPSLAVSAAFSTDDLDNVRYDTAAAVAMQVLADLPSAGHEMINLNVPQRGLEDLRGVRAAPLSKTFKWRSYIESIENGLITRTYRESDDPIDPNTDVGLLDQGWATISSLTGMSTVDCAGLADAIDLSATATSTRPAAS